MKTCSKCQIPKETTEFYAINGWCKSCVAKDNKNRRQRKKDGIYIPKYNTVPNTDPYDRNISILQKCTFPGLYRTVGNINKPTTEIYIDRYNGQYTLIDNGILICICNTIEDIAHTLSTLGVRLGARQMEDGKWRLISVRNSCGVPIASSLIEMDQPRPLQPIEIARVTDIPIELVEFYLQKKQLQGYSGARGYP